MHQNKVSVSVVALALAAGLAATLSACGGGGGSSTNATAMGSVNVAVTDAPSKDFTHAWITLREIRFHTSDAVNAGDPGWLRYPLAAPVTVDLAALANGSLSQVFGNLQLPVGTYRQIRLVLVDDSDPLTGSAQSQGLTWNDQVDWTDAQGNTRSSPLEIASPRQGIGINGTFTVTSAAPLNLVLDFDIEHDVVRFVHNNNQAFTLKPLLRYFDLAQSGAVNGRVDTANLCATTATAGCAYNLVIKAEQLHPNGTHHVVTRATTIRPDGTFTLWPLRVPAGSNATTIDVLVRGRNMESILVRNVPVTAGTTPASNATTLSSGVLPLTIGGEYTANAASPLSPTGAWVNFYQTLSGTGQAEVPYEIRFRHVNPFTGVFVEDIALSAGPLHVGSYVANGSPTLATNSPVQGNGGFLVFGDALGYTRTEATSDPLVPPSGAGPALFTIPPLAVNAAVATADSIAGTILQTTAGKYDKGELVVVWMGTIVTTMPLDSVLAANGGTGGAYTVSNLPGGSTAKPLPGAWYYLYARVWNSANPVLTLRRVDVNGFADLRTGSASGMNLTLN